VDSCGAGCVLTFMKNDEPVGTMNITGLNQQAPFSIAVDLIAEVDTLWVVVSPGVAVAENLTVFVSFTPTPPL